MNLKTNPELLPLVEWWEKDGKQTVILLLAVAVAFGGWYGWKQHRASVKAAAASALVNAYTTEEIEEAVAKLSKTQAGGALKLRLAKSYFDAGRFEEALAQYDGLAGGAPDGFADIPTVGRAQCLEALGRYAEAQQAFDAFAKANPKSYLALTARLGAARALVQSGDRKAALARIGEIRSSVGDDEVAKARIDATEKAIKRYEKKSEAKAPAAITGKKPATK